MNTEAKDEKPIRKINAFDIIAKLDPKSDVYIVMSGLADTVRVLASRYVMWRTLAWVAIAGNVIQFFASSWMK